LLKPLVDAHPFVVALAGGLYHGLFAAGFAAWLHDRFFATFNDDVLRPIQRPLAFDPLWGTAITQDERDAAPIPWIEPREPGERKAAWDALRSFAFKNAGDGRTSLRGRPAHPDFVPFLWTIVTGRAGSGKTRMAVEFARALAQRDVLGVEDKERRRARRKLRRGEWVRRAMPHLRRRDSHPWDAGWLLPGRLEGPDRRSARTPVDERFLDRLRGWSPRRPTILLLDDPRPADARRVVEMLLARQANYHFPVRLLIVDQAVPLELSISESQSGDSRYLDGFAGELIALSSAARLTADDVRRMAIGLGMDSGVWRVPGRPGTDAQVEHFLRETRGNALLAELGLRWLKRGRTLHDIT